MKNNLQYPIYVRELDDNSFRKVADVNDFDWYEKTDIEGGLYDGWDSAGNYFKLKWQNTKECCSAVIQNNSDYKGFSEAINDYERSLGALNKTPDYLIDPIYLRQVLQKIESTSN